MSARLVMLTVAVAASLIGATAASAAPGPCERPAGSRVLKASKNVVIYYRSRSAGPERMWWACHRGSGRRTLALRGGRTEIGTLSATGFRVAGRFVAFVRHDANRSQDDWRVRVIDSRSGQLRSTSSLTGYGAARIRSLRLSPRGPVAWILTDLPDLQQLEVESVQALESGGSRTLDTAPKGAISGLRADGQTLTWNNGGQRRTATLAP